MPALKNCHNIADLRKRAKAKLPKPIFDYIDGGADDEWTMRRNTEAFNDYQLIPNYLRNIETINLQTKLFGTTMALPFFLAPTGMSRLFHHEKELAACRAAEKFDTFYSLSTLATTRLEEVATATSGAKMFQIYIFKDRELTREFVQRCKTSGYESLCLTVDTMVAGNRERDLKNGMTLPPQITPQNLLSYATSFSWLFNLIRYPDFKLANVAHRVDALKNGAMGLIQYANSQFDRTVTWEDVEWLAAQWDGPLVIKGLQSVDDVKRARSVGASAVMVSNHGGRQLESAPAPIDCIPALRDAVGDDLELIVDGGIRRGTHIVKALALGANACSIGRPYLYGLAAGGQKGVELSIKLLKKEVDQTMALLGCASVDELGSQHIGPVGRLEASTHAASFKN